MKQHLQLSVLADHVTNVKTLDGASLRHVECCRHCRSDLRWLEKLRALRECEPPKPAVDSVLNAFETNTKESGAA